MSYILFCVLSLILTEAQVSSANLGDWFVNVEPKIEHWERINYINKLTGYYRSEGEYIDCRGKRLVVGNCALNGVPVDSEILVWHPKYGYFQTIVKDRISKRYSNRVDIYVPNRKVSKMMTSKGVKAWIRKPQVCTQSHHQKVLHKNKELNYCSIKSS